MKDKNVYQGNNRNNNTYRVLLIIMALLLIVIIGVSGAIIYMDQQEGARDSISIQYTAYLQNAERYLQEEDYDQAIASLRAAIKDNPQEYRAYMQLAQVYVQRGYTGTAIDVLQSGIDQTDSPELREYLQQLAFTLNKEGSAAVGVSERKSEGDTSSSGREVSLNSYYINQISSLNYDDMDRSYGAGVVLGDKMDGYTQVRYDKEGLTAYYINPENSNMVLDNTGKPFHNAYPKMLCFDSASKVLNSFPGDITKDRLQLIVGYNLQLKAYDNEHYYMEFAYIGDLTIRFMCDENGTVTANDKVWFYLPEKAITAKATYTATVLDATTGEGLDGVTCTFSGPETVTTTSNSYGVFSAELKAGTYTLTLNKNGYSRVENSFTLAEKENRSTDQYIMSPVLASGQIRLVLSWSEMPEDLDSHLEGTMDDGRSFHVAFFDPIASGIAELDVDDVTGFGPETITITNLNGVFNYYVEDFRSTGEMGSIGTAQVTIYFADGSTQTVNIHPSCINRWNVLKIDHGNVTIINN